MPFCWIETYTFLSYFSAVGISLAIVAMLCFFGYCFDLFATGGYSSSPLIAWDTAGVFGHIGVAMFVFEGNAVVMNVRAEARHQKAYPKILIWSIVTTLSLFMAFAMVTYFTYRSETMDIVAKNLPIDGLGIFIRVCMWVNAMCSYPFQILTAFDIVE